MNDVEGRAKLTFLNKDMRQLQPSSLRSLETLPEVLHVTGRETRLLDGSTEEVAFMPHPDAMTEAGNYEYYESLGRGAHRKLKFSFLGGEEYLASTLPSSHSCLLPRFPSSFSFLTTSFLFSFLLFSPSPLVYGHPFLPSLPLLFLFSFSPNWFFIL